MGILLAVLGSGGLLVQSARGQGTQHSTRELSGSETNTSAIFQSLDRLGAKDTRLRRLEDELNRSDSTFSSRRALDGVLPLSSGPLQMPTVSSGRKKDDLTHTDGWLSKPEDVFGTASDDALGFPGMQSAGKGKKASWDQIYRSLKDDGSGAPGLGTSVKSSARQPSDTQDDQETLGPFQESAAKLKSDLAATEFGASIFKPATARSSFSDFFGVGATGLTPEQEKAHKDYMDSYVTTLFGNSAGVSINAMDAMSPGAKAQTPATSPLGGLPEVARSDSFKSGSGFNSTLSTSPLPDMNANALNQWNPLYTEPKLELPKSQPFFTPPVEMPRRRFF